MASLLHVRTTPEPLPAIASLRADGIDVIETSPAAEELEQSAASGITAALIAPDVATPVAVARTVHRANPDAHIVFVTHERDEPELRRSLLLAPRIGTHWSVARADAAEDAVRSALGAASRRRNVRDTLGRMNVRLTRTPVDAARRPIPSEHFLASILDQMSDGIIAVDARNVVMTYNAAAAQAFGGDLSIGATFSLGDGEIVRDGAVIDVRSTAVHDESGRHLGNAIVTRDVTARRRTEQRRSFVAAATTALASTLDVDATLDRFARVVAQQFAAFCVVDLVEDGRMLRRAVAVRPEQSALAPALWRSTPRPDQHHPSNEAIERGTAIVRNEAEDDAIADIVGRSEDTPPPVNRVRSFIAVPLRSGGRIIGALLFGRAEPFDEDDVAVTEELARNASTTLHNAWLYHAAEEANRAKDEFLATISHELRTPMTSIIGWIQMMRIGDLDPEMTQEAMRAIEQSAHMQAQLIDDLLDLSRIQMGKLSLQVQEVDLPGVVRAAVDTIRPAANAKSIRIDTVVSPDLPKVLGDPNRLQQVVWNLLSNAVKFTDKKGRVTVTLDAQESKARVRVTDTGQGIDPAFLPYVFDRFRQADSSVTRSFGGLGLGLSIVRHIVELHGGTISASSEGRGTGSMFTVLLPVAALSAPAPPVASSTEKLADLHGIRVLVVDDEESSARVIAALLTHAGAEVETRSSVDSALEAIRRQRPDVLISDLAMPHEDGFALIAHIRNVLRIPASRLPAVALTAMREVQSRVQILGAGFQRFVTKPVDAHYLAGVVADLVRREE